MLDSCLEPGKIEGLKMLDCCLEPGKIEGLKMLDLQTISAIDSDNLQVQH